jgi:putative transposase
MLEVEDGALPVGMQSLNFRYAVNFNQRHGLRGHVQFARYGAKRILDDSHLLDAYKYVVNNPVEAHLCARAADWPWSSFAGTVGLTEAHSYVDPTRVLGCLDPVRELAAAKLLELVNEP